MTARSTTVSITPEELEELQAQLDVANGKVDAPQTTWNENRGGCTVITADARQIDTISGTFMPVNEDAFPEEHSSYEEVEFSNGSKAYIRKPGM